MRELHRTLGERRSGPRSMPRSPRRGSPATPNAPRRLEQVKAKSQGYETTFEEAAALYEAKRTIEAVNLSMNESEVRADQMVSGLGQLIRENDAQLDLSSQAPVLTVIAIGSRAAGADLRSPSEPQHQPAAALAGSTRPSGWPRAIWRPASRSTGTTRSDRWRTDQRDDRQAARSRLRSPRRRRPIWRPPRVRCRRRRRACRRAPASRPRRSRRRRRTSSR